MGYAALTLPTLALETYLERLPAADLNRRTDDWKQMRREGWDVTVLVDLNGRDVIALACRGAAPKPLVKFGVVRAGDAA